VAQEASEQDGTTGSPELARGEGPIVGCDWSPDDERFSYPAFT
jgi:hypothetical protein